MHNVVILYPHRHINTPYPVEPIVKSTVAEQNHIAATFNAQEMLQAIQDKTEQANRYLEYARDAFADADNFYKQYQRYQQAGFNWLASWAKGTEL